MISPEEKVSCLSLTNLLGSNVAFHGNGIVWQLLSFSICIYVLNKS